VVESLIRLSLFRRFAADGGSVGALVKDLQRCGSHVYPGNGPGAADLAFREGEKMLRSGASMMARTAARSLWTFVFPGTKRLQTRV